MGVPSYKMMKAQVDEEALMAAYQRGDKDAFRRLFDRLGPRVHALFMHMFRDRATAEDLMQQTFLKIHRARDRYDPTLRVRPWVLAIAGRVGVDELRRRKVVLEEAAEEATLERADAAASLSLADRTDRLERTELQKLVHSALDRLPESQRIVIHLHRFEELTFGEIANVLGTTEGAVKLRAFRAYAQLRKVLVPMLGADREAV